MRAIRITSLAASLLLASGCVVVAGPGGGGGSGAPTGSLTVSWTFGGLSCTNAGVGNIEIQGKGEVDGDTFDKVEPCAQFAGGIQIGNLSIENYDVMITAYDTTGQVVYYQLSAPKVLAIQPGSNTYDIDVPPVIGDLTLDWTFGGSGVCGSVAQVQIVLLDGNGNTVDNSTYACQDNGGEAYTDLPIGTYSVSMTGLDANGQVLYTGQNNNLQVTPGGSSTYVIDMN